MHDPYVSSGICTFALFALLFFKLVLINAGHQAFLYTLQQVIVLLDNNQEVVAAGNTKMKKHISTDSHGLGRCDTQLDFEERCMSGYAVAIATA